MDSATRTRPMAPRERAIVGSLVVVAVFAWGTAFYGLGYYVLRLHDLRGWSLSALSNVVLVFYAVAVALSFWVAKQLARRGPRPVIALGAAMLGAALIAMPHVRSLPALVAVFLVLSVGWSATNTNPISTTIMAWFPGGQRELAIALIGASIGGIVLIPALAQIDDRFGFTAATTALGVAAIVLVGGVAVFVIDAPATSHGVSAARGDAMAWGILRRGDYWVLAVGLALGIAVQGGFLVHQLSLLATSMSDTAAARVVGVATLAALVGRLGPIVIADRIRPGVVGAGYLVVQTVALLVLGALEHSVAVLTAMSVVYGLGVGVLITMPSLLTRTTFPELAYTAAFPVVNLSFQLPLTIGAPALALLHDRLDGYRPAMWILAAADAIAVVLLLVNDRATR